MEESYTSEAQAFLSSRAFDPEDVVPKSIDLTQYVTEKDEKENHEKKDKQ